MQNLFIWKYSANLIKKKKNCFFHIIQLLLFIIPFCAIGNGGPIEGCFTQKSGSIKLITKKDIKILSEDLNIELTKDEVHVKVIYRLKNLGGTDVIKYGFPVDYIKEDKYTYISYCNTISNFSYKFNDKEVEYIVEEEADKSKIKGPFIDEGHNIKRDWYITELSFDEQQTSLLEVNYSISPHYNYWGKFIDTNFSFTTNKRFLYDLSPCGFFGDGSIDTLSVTIKKPDYLCFDQINIRGIQDYITYNNHISWYAENYNPSNQALDIDYRTSPTNTEIDEKANHLPNSIIKKINVSSSLKGYPKENLIDLDENTAWVEGVDGFGKGEWIEFEFKEKVFIHGIGILNGYYKNGTVYNQNNRIKSLELSIKVEDLEKKNIENDTTIIHLEPQCFFEEFHNNIQIIYDLGDIGIVYNSYEEMMEKSNSTLKVKIKILDTYSGDKYDDTCISEVLFYGYPHNNKLNHW